MSDIVNEYVKEKSTEKGREAKTIYKNRMQIRKGTNEIPKKTYAERESKETMNSEHFHLRLKLCLYV